MQINKFLKEYLKLELHPQKSKTIPIKKGISFLGFRMFYAHMLPKKSNMRKAKQKLSLSKKAHEEQAIDYDSIYNHLMG